jgi:lysozyme family protein
LVVKHEGGYVNNPKDPGKETYIGISRLNHPHWKGWIILDKIQDKKWNQTFENAELESLVIDFYKNYFKQRNLNLIQNETITLCIFDFCVNSGGAIQVIQEMLNEKYNANLTADNKFGKQTATVINKIQNIKELNNNILDARLAYVKTLKVFKEFGNGWIKRIESFRI